jgi:predicted GIY-YIG superfamily endonuclease
MQVKNIVLNKFVSFLYFCSMNQYSKIWTLELCREEALKYTYRTAFHKNSPAYKAAYKKGWLDEICGHMVKPKPHNLKWTFEACEQEAKKYKFKKDFHANSSIAFQIASKNKWLKQICSHMTEIKKPHKYWTKEKCLEEALKYKHRNNFSDHSKSAYSAAQYNNWIDDICGHMSYQGSKMFRFVYSFTFTDGSIYFGLTNDFTRRIIDHKSDPFSKVNQHIKLTGEEPAFALITPDALATEVAQEIEKQLIKEYTEKGFKVLNSDKGGGIGGSELKWTKEACRLDALKYKTRGEYQKSLSYSSAHKRRWLDDICGHMEVIKKPNGFWNIERCTIEANKYSSKKEFREMSSVAYGAAFKYGWLNEISGHMEVTKKPMGFWNLETCISSARSCNSYIDFQKKYSSAYNVALKNNWLEEIQKLYSTIKKPNGYWSFERCEQEAKKYSTRSKFRKCSCSAYDASHKNKWLDTFFPKNDLG